MSSRGFGRVQTVRGFRPPSLLSKLGHPVRTNCSAPATIGGPVKGSLSQAQRSRWVKSCIRSSATRFDSDQPKVERSWRYLR